MNLSVFSVSEKVITLFVILIAGIIAKKTDIIDNASTKKMSGLLLYITQPMLIITSFQISFDPEKLKNGLAIFALSAAIHIIASVFSYFIYKPVGEAGKKKVFEMATIFCNCAFLGYPVLTVIFGSELGIFYGAFYAMFFNIYIWIYGVYLITRNEGGKTGKKNTGFPISKIFLNPGMIASAAGIVFFISGAKLTPVLYNSAKMIGDVTFPLSMVIIGSLIADIKLKEMFLQAKNYYYAFVKLLLIPALTAVICCALKLPVLLVYMGTVMTSMPSAANVAIFAETYNADSKTAAIAVGFSTLLSAGTVPLMIYFADSLLFWRG